MSIQSVSLSPKTGSFPLNPLEEQAAQNRLKVTSVFGLSLPFLSLSERNALAQVNKDLGSCCALLLSKDVASFHRPNQGSQNLSINYRNGNQYVGALENGKMHGQGTLTFANGNQYAGAWENGEAHGQGTLTYANGDQYVGAWENCKMHGQGTLTFADGDQYVGAWENGNRHGQGTLTLRAHGYRCEGAWKNDKMHGPVTRIDLITNERTFRIFQNGLPMTTQDLFLSLLYAMSP